MAVSIGNPAPDFKLPAFSGRDDEYRLSDYRGKIVVLAFWSPTCSTCRRYTAYLDGFAEIYGSRGVEFLAIASQPWDTPERINAIFHRRRPGFPILLDRGGAVAHRFGVEVLPTVFLLDRQGAVQYWGAIDDWDPAEKWSGINYLQEAVDALLLGRSLPFSHIPAMGRELVLAPAAEEAGPPAAVHPRPVARPAGLPKQSPAAEPRAENGSDRPPVEEETPSRRPAPVAAGRPDERQPAMVS